MVENLIIVAQEQIEKNRRDIVIDFIRARLLRRANLEKDLALVDKELEELNTLPLKEAYDKYNKYGNYEEASVRRL